MPALFATFARVAERSLYMDKDKVIGDTHRCAPQSGFAAVAQGLWVPKTTSPAAGLGGVMQQADSDLRLTKAWRTCITLLPNGRQRTSPGSNFRRHSPATQPKGANQSGQTLVSVTVLCLLHQRPHPLTACPEQSRRGAGCAHPRQRTGGAPPRAFPTSAGAGAPYPRR